MTVAAERGAESNVATGGRSPNAPRRGALLVNLGSPDSTDPGDVGRYLTQFLMDPRVLDTPWPIRKFLVSGLIVPKRKFESAHAYQRIWTEEGSPLVITSRRVAETLRTRTPHPVGLGMRYGSPSIKAGLTDLLQRAGGDLDEIYMIPLYPHYAMSSYETVVVEAERELKKLGTRARLVIHPPFYNDPSYIKALVESARPYLETPFDLLLFSYHGIPERHVRKSDPSGTHCLSRPDCCSIPSPAADVCYRRHCFETTRLFLEESGIPREKASQSFQSRLGRDPWLKPYTDFELKRFAEEGVKRMLVICPAFVSDCLETLEEIGMRGREDFIEAGGEDLRLIPCLNEHPMWIDTLAGWVNKPAVV